MADNDTKTHRFSDPIKYTDYNGKKKFKQLHFELSAVQFFDWMIANPIDAEKLQTGFEQMRAVYEDDSRDLTVDEIRTMLGLVKVVAELSAGVPTDDGEYFIKDPNWTSSAAYLQFREVLFTNPKKLEIFLTTLLSEDIMTNFSNQLEAAQAQAAVDSGKSIDDMTPEELRAHIKSQNTVTQLPTPPTDDNDAS